MEQRAGARQRRREALGAGKVAFHQLGIETFEVAAVAPLANQQTQGVAACHERSRNGGADEAGRAGDEDGEGHAVAPKAERREV